MDVDVKWGSIITVIVIMLLAILVIDANSQIKSIEGCKGLRIRPFPKEFFTWEGVVELNKTGKYQPSCL